MVGAQQFCIGEILGEHQEMTMAVFWLIVSG